MKKYLLVVFSVLLVGSSFADPQVFEQDGKKGVRDDNGNVIIPASYDGLGWSDRPFAFHGNVVGYFRDGKWGLLSRENQQLTLPEFSYISFKNSGHYVTVGRYVPAVSADRYGLIDRSGKKVLDPNYLRLEVYQDKILAWSWTENGQRCGVLDLRLRTIVPFNYKDIKPLGGLRYLAETPEGRKELLNDSGQRLTSFLIDSLTAMEENRVIFWSGHKAGLMDRDGNIIINPDFKDFRVGENGNIEVLRFPEWKSVDIAGNIEFTAEFDRIVRISDSTLLVSASNRSWIADNKGKRLSEEVFDWVSIFENGLSVVKKSNKYGVAAADGSLLLPLNYTIIHRDGEFFKVRDASGKWSVHDQFGVRKNQVPYDSVGNYRKLYFPISKNGFWGLMNRSGAEILHCVYDSIGSISMDLIEVGFKGLYGIVDTNGSWIVVPSRGKKILVNESIYLVTNEGNTQVMSFEGDIVYFTDNQLEINDGYFLEHLSNGMVWKISFSGVIEADKITNIAYRNSFRYSEFEDIFPPSEGYSAIRKDGKYGFIDDQNRLRVANRYDSVQMFSEGLAPIKLIGKWGFIDKEERLVIQPSYEAASPFKNGISWVKYKGKFNIIDRQNRLLFQTGFDGLSEAKEGRIIARMGNHVGIIDSNGKILINYTFDKLEDIGNGYVIAEKLGRKGVVDLTGIYIIPRNYSEVRYDRFLDRYLVKTEASWTDARLLTSNK